MSKSTKIVIQEDLDNFPWLVEEYDIQVGDLINWNYGGGAHTESSGDPLTGPGRPPIPPQ